MSYTYPEKFIRDSVIAPFLLLSVVIFTLPRVTQLNSTGNHHNRSLFSDFGFILTLSLPKLSILILYSIEFNYFPFKFHFLSVVLGTPCFSPCSILTVIGDLL